MANRTKRIFISDIHMGDVRSMNDPNHYGWFNKNIPVLGDFLAEQLEVPDVKEIVILGDLFDTWVIPVNKDPLISFNDICSNPDNKPVIDNLKALAENCDIKLTYIPGNHDMGMDAHAMITIRKFMLATFPGIRFFCNSTVPWGKYAVRNLVAEHGNHYCFFNAPDMWTAKDTFLPIGYFISRIAAYKVSQTGTSEDYYDILVRFLKESWTESDFIENMFRAIAQDADLKLSDIFNLKEVPGFPVTMTVEAMGNRFSNLFQNWPSTRANIGTFTAMKGDAFEDLSEAASWAYFNHFNSNINIVIFGHTHKPCLELRDLDPQADPFAHKSNDPWFRIYANCGSWIDERWLDEDVRQYGCTYVETEEDANSGRYHVRLKSYTSKTVIKEGFIKL